MELQKVWNLAAEDCDREKWVLEQKSQVLADERLLQGLNTVFAIHNIYQMLSTPSRAASSSDVSAFFSKRLNQRNVRKNRLRPPEDLQTVPT